MKTIFILANVTLGILLSLLGVRVLHDLLQKPGFVAAGLVALALGATFLWLAKQTVFGLKE